MMRWVTHEHVISLISVCFYLSLSLCFAFSLSVSLSFEVEKCQDVDSEERAKKERSKRQTGRQTEKNA
jgi:hypothetical protein